ncbi:phage tail protein I [Methylobacterium planeticum]|uniref:Phage tail protein I n=1 Tax=Methylobacterium planeticum TaxID=2615211 RepID=A0A6N6MG39_9HYPH|nr:phage tail protein I [Methylobacterium planeticum]KAB1069261.1 phage tail protein I [Methylobacterium planeticum]
MSASGLFAGRDLLPSGSTTLEQVLADEKWIRASALDPDIIRTIVNPATCPSPLLPWLAWSFSVDVWDEAWSEATKRRVIAASPEVHRRKGTRLAVRLALDALGAQTTIREWWESTPPARRGTLRVRVHADGSGPILDLKLLAQLREAVKRSKPKSRVFELEVALQSEAPLLMAATTRSITRTTLLPIVPPPPVAVAPLLAAVSYGAGVRRLVIRPSTPGDTPALAGLGVAAVIGRAARKTVLYPYPYT